ncbi:MAG: PepSY domain-containing protein [Bacteroidetes bacterium]|nr:PepSY domain-containing protein [Bacteroidota bacterium]
MNQKTRTLAKQARVFRKIHKYVAVPLMLFMLIFGITGLLLTWKSELKLTPPTVKSKLINRSIIPLEDIQNIAINYADSLQLSSLINRIDYRPGKGIAKIRFENHFTELQIDCQSGEIISVKQRTDNIVEMIHDGSIIDYLFKSKSENAKLLYSTLTSLGLILLAFSGFMVWLRPKQIKSHKRKIH